jgi:hypothetical protein
LNFNFSCHIMPTNQLDVFPNETCITVSVQYAGCGLASLSRKTTSPFGVSDSTHLLIHDFKIHDSMRPALGGGPGHVPRTRRCVYRARACRCVDARVISLEKKNAWSVTFRRAGQVPTKEPSARAIDRDRGRPAETRGGRLVRPGSPVRPTAARRPRFIAIGADVLIVVDRGNFGP